ncbi:ABC transporter ATP-binding protein [Candidatus Woesearchaeota archaeon]|nr:ABC transporter ATP-binding protein [Candidatus Woesearchaeota archaeon]
MPSTSLPTLLRCSHLSKAYGKKPILQDISFEVQREEIFGILGTGGSGKTALLHLLVGFDEPLTGTVEYRAQHVLDMGDAAPFRSVVEILPELKKQFGFAAQEPSFYPLLTVRENLAYFAAMYGLSGDVQQTNIKILMALMDLLTVPDTRAMYLSHSQQKRLDIACAVIHDPKIVILDEPTLDVDSFVKGKIWEFIRKMNEKGTTVIITSNDGEELEAICSRILMLYNGRVLKIAKPKELRAYHSKLQEIHLQTQSGSYDLLLKLLEKEHTKLDIKKVTVKDGHLILTTPNLEASALFALKSIKESGDALLDISVARPTLKEVFEQLIEEANKGGKS